MAESKWTVPANGLLQKELRANTAAMVKRAEESQYVETPNEWSGSDWDSFRDDLVLFSLYELPHLLAALDEIERLREQIGRYEVMTMSQAEEIDALKKVEAAARRVNLSYPLRDDGPQSDIDYYVRELRGLLVEVTAQ